MNPESVIDMKDVFYSYNLADQQFSSIRFLKNRGEQDTPYTTTVSAAQKKLHDANPVLKDLWEQYATMVKLVQEQ